MTKRTRTSAEAINTRVVGIGASAGGITALQSLFQALPAHPNLAFVVIQHLMPGQPSQTLQSNRMDGFSHEK